MNNVKDPLEYTVEELSALSKEELIVLMNEAEMLESQFHTKQLVEKTLINALYGAIANKYFPLFNEDLASAITGNGRFFIRKLANNIECTLQKMLHHEKPYVVAGDTDSVVSSTLVKTNRGDIKIGDLYDQLNGNIESRGVNNYIKHVTDNIDAGSISNKLQYEEKQIKYVMKHKVQKRMFKIKCNGDEVIITEDHSIMILRDNNLISVKPNDIKKSDKIIKI